MRPSMPPSARSATFSGPAARRPADPERGAEQQQPRRLLADAEAAEDLAEQFIRAEGAGDLAERIVREPQLFGQQIERRIAAIGMLAGEDQVVTCDPQGL